LTDDTVQPVDIDDLNAFKTQFFSEDKPEEVEVTETEDDALETLEDEDAEPQEDENESEEEDDEPEIEEVPQPKGKKSAKDRIDQLTADKWELRRELDLLRSQMEQLQTGKPEVKQDEVPALRETLPADAPSPDALDKDGLPIYELGEFDPQYIRDLSKWSVTQEMNAAKEKAAQEAQQAEIARAQTELTQVWETKLEKAEEVIPDIRESIGDLVEVFKDVPPQYGDYLAGTLMSLDNGPEIMHYLSQNIGEAQKIVASGPTAAALALGRLDAQLQSVKTSEEKRNTKRVSEASAPPENRVRGKGGQFSVRPDTRDLAAFKREFFKD
jgi:hypothetical protein